MTVQILQLSIALVAVFGGAASIYSLWHAKSPASPESPQRGPVHLTTLAVNVVVLGGVAAGIASGCRRGCEAEWLVLLVFVLPWAVVAGALGRQCKVRQRRYRRHPWGIAAMLLMLPVLPGCSFIHKGDLTAWGFLTEIDAEVSPDGTIRARKSAQTEFARAVVGEAVKAGVAAGRP